MQSKQSTSEIPCARNNLQQPRGQQPCSNHLTTISLCLKWNAFTRVLRVFVCIREQSPRFRCWALALPYTHSRCSMLCIVRTSVTQIDTQMTKAKQDSRHYYFFFLFSCAPLFSPMCGRRWRAWSICQCVAAEARVSAFSLHSIYTWKACIRILLLQLIPIEWATAAATTNISIRP